MQDSDRRHFISKFVFDKNGCDNIGIKNDVKLFIARAEIFDYSSTKGVKIANKKVIENRKMDKSSCLNGVLIIF